MQYLRVVLKLDGLMGWHANAVACWRFESARFVHSFGSFRRSGLYVSGSNGRALVRFLCRWAVLSPLSEVACIETL